MKKKTIAALGIGAAIGTGLGIFFAPKSGKETRNDLKHKIDDLKSKASQIELEDVKKYVNEKINSIEKELKDLNKEKVIKIAKEKANKVEQECKELAKYVKDKSVPFLMDAVESLRQKALESTKQMVNKLESNNR